MCITGKCGRMKEMAWIDGHFSGSCIGVLYVLLCKIVVSCHVLILGYQCELEKEKKRCDKGIAKAQALVDEAQVKLDEENEKIRQVEIQVLLLLCMTLWNCFTDSLMIE